MLKNVRTAMSLRLLIYSAQIMGITLDELIGNIEPNYKTSALEHALVAEIHKLDNSKKVLKIRKTL